MASPLTPSAGNSSTPATTLRHKPYEITSYTAQTTSESDSDDPPSSPFVETIDHSDRENASPSKVRLPSKSPIERSHNSPIKMMKSRTSPIQSPQKPTMNPVRSPRKLSSPEKRFPVKPASSPEKRPVVVEKTLNFEDVLRDNEGLKKAIAILEDTDNDSNDEDHVSDETLVGLGGSHEHENTINFDDTMASTFSDFSAVPDMTMFAKIGHSPSKYASMGPTPRRNFITTPATARRPPPPTSSRSPSPTPRHHRYGKSRDDGNTTNLILDFTDQINGFSGRNPSPVKQSRLSPSKSSTMPDMAWYNQNGATPSRHNMSNLLDFDIPPAPTPRSLPSITPRELESLKSNFLSEISSLKASLSGKEAEVQSLKTAVGDAEKRVGESMEQVREERNLKEQLEAEREEWEKRSREMEAVLRNVKEEIVHGERQCDELEGRLEESERRREAAEMMAQEAEGKLAATRAGKATPTSETFDTKSGECSCGGSRAVELAVEKVSRELHTLYKDKHETKVAALKKSYERRWDKRVKELEEKVEDLSKENEDFRLGRDTTMTKIAPLKSETPEDIERRAATEAKTKELEAELKGLSQVVKSVKEDNAELRQLLEEERFEKGKLVAAVDEMMPLVAAFDDMLSNMPENVPQTPTSSAAQASAPQTDSKPIHTTTVENLRGSISRASGLRAPAVSGSGESRIARGAFAAGLGHERTKSGSSGIGGVRPGSGLGFRGLRKGGE